MSNIIHLEPNDLVVLTLNCDLTPGQEHRAQEALQQLLDATGTPVTAAVYHGGAVITVMRPASVQDSQSASEMCS